MTSPKVIMTASRRTFNNSFRCEQLRSLQGVEISVDFIIQKRTSGISRDIMRHISESTVQGAFDSSIYGKLIEIDIHASFEKSSYDTPSNTRPS